MAEKRALAQSRVRSQWARSTTVESDSALRVEAQRPLDSPRVASSVLLRHGNRGVPGERLIA